MSETMEPFGLKEQAHTVFVRMQEEVYRLNNSKGWFDEGRSVGDMVALLHSEVSEVLEAFRTWNMADATENIPDNLAASKPEGIGTEMADVLIRLLDMAKRWDIDLVAEFDRKMKYNWTRPYRHGNRYL